MLGPLIFGFKSSPWLKFFFSMCFVACNSSFSLRGLMSEAALSIVDKCRGKYFLIWGYFCLPAYALVPNSEHVLQQLWFVLSAGKGGFYPFGTHFLLPYLLFFLVLWCWCGSSVGTRNVLWFLSALNVCVCVLFLPEGTPGPGHRGVCVAALRGRCLSWMLAAECFPSPKHEHREAPRHCFHILGCLSSTSAWAHR